MLVLNFFHKTKNGTLWEGIRDSKIIRKEYLGEYVTKYFVKVSNC